MIFTYIFYSPKNLFLQIWSFQDLIFPDFLKDFFRKYFRIFSKKYFIENHR